MDEVFNGDIYKRYSGLYITVWYEDIPIITEINKLHNSTYILDEYGIRITL